MITRPDIDIPVHCAFSIWEHGIKVECALGVVNSIKSSPDQQIFNQLFIFMIDHPSLCTSD